MCLSLLKRIFLIHFSIYTWKQSHRLLLLECLMSRSYLLNLHISNHFHPIDQHLVHCLSLCTIQKMI
ncbi:hypothetical protein WN66_06072 [Saccharomyces cerevisiae]|uniref:Putative uncharacterized protein YOR231C-A n=2 Tax=Saccharomyces cerevisiae TaxID=4932 RepID=YO231_YEAST|nr:RecName: Full=Putative uncharacterized protein YOR231C-A [Saccharomyces cerevisiae S288C]AAL79293.1 unknown [Saccharomyces cerevisiae]KZV08120.1 hypothetical protein WN66_06072 [Saccharomyces cerevisiae]CAY86514.1 EC1118_1O4_4588p [Saccharomyces cerevisiae EC1118]